MTVYIIHNREFECKDEAESYLTSLFKDMCSELEIDLGDDSPAWREFFNDWTNLLCSDGIICESSYMDLCPIGDEFE